MSDNKKYYYLKLKENFFDSAEIKILESMPNGYKYSNLLLKLYLKSLRYEGMLRLNEYIPYNTEMISAITSIDVDTVRVAFDLLKKLKLIEVLDDGTIFMLEIQNFIGKSSTEADRIRNYRKKVEDTKKLIQGECTNVQQMYDKSTPEIEKEIEIEIEKNKKKKKKKSEFDDLIENYTENLKLRETLYEFIKMRKTIKSQMTSNALKLMLNKLDKLSEVDDEKIEIINNSIMNCWKGIFPLKNISDAYGNNRRSNKEVDKSGSARQNINSSEEESKYNFDCY